MGDSVPSFKSHPTQDIDFGFSIDFKAESGIGPASRVFLAMKTFVEACEHIDRALVTSIDSSIKPVIMLEDLREGSLKAFFRMALEALDDQALKELNWKPAIGKYLVNAKYLLLEWAENKDKTPEQIGSLKKICCS